MRADLLHLLRNLRRSPANAVAAVLTLSLTLGGGASIFAVVDAVLLTPPPFTKPEAVFVLGETPIGDQTATPRTVTYATFESWRDRAASLAALEAFDGTNLTLTGLGAAERVAATDITPGFFTLLGAVPAFGRSFGLTDVGQPVVIVSHAFWRGRLAGDPGAIGRGLTLGGRTHTIVGVLPESFVFALDAGDLWRPIPVAPAQAARSGYRVRVLARLGRAVSPAFLQSALEDVSRASSPPAHVVSLPIARAIRGDSANALGLLAGAAVLAMVIAFTNLAGLLIVRSIDRRRELAVRSALGARRSDIARQMLLEAQTLVSMGTLGGVILALWMTPVVGRLAQFGSAAGAEATVSWRVVLGLSMAALLCGSICGLLPALVASRQSTVDALRRGATPPPRERALRRLFVTAEVALAFVLLVSVTLLGRSLFGLLSANPGFDATGVTTLSVSLPAATYPSDERVASFYSTLQDTLEQRFGPRTVSIVDEIPLSGNRTPSLVSAGPADPGREAVIRTAASDYFDVMRTPIFAGRSFNRGDNTSAPARVVVSELLAEQLFGSERPVGRRVRLNATGQTAEIIGVAGDTRHRALDEPPLATVYLSALQAPSNSSVIVVRAGRPAADVTAAVREEVARLDANLPVYSVRSMQEIVDASPGMPARRVLTAAFAGFSLLAVTLGALGLFGLAAHDVASRRGELALRIALGADPVRILGTTLGRGAWIIGSGLLVGALLSMWTARAFSSVVVGADRFDAVSVAVAAAVLMLAGAAAVLPAALRAAHTDPVTALRAE